MSFSFAQFDEWLRSCPHCGTASGFTESLCEECLVFLESLSDAGLIHPEYGFPVRALFTWRIGGRGETLISQFIQAQKRGRAPKTISRFTGAFLQQRITAGPMHPCVLVPAPPKDPLVADHAETFTHELSRRGVGEIVRALEWPEESASQKDKSAEDRAQVILHATQDPKALRNQRVIFVDDVITTGSTALAAREALGWPEHFEVWALACRKRGTLI